jgi:hypothetical protein
LHTSSGKAWNLLAVRETTTFKYMY